MECNMCKLEIFLPQEYVIEVMEALSEIGVGKIGNYDHCFSFTEVKGFWRPLVGSNPFEGEVGNLSSGKEVKLETRCERELLAIALQTIKSIHPYEEPVINVFPLLAIS